MQGKIIWEQNSTDPRNADNFAIINQWWKTLEGREIVMSNRVIPAKGSLEDLDWTWQRFDERFPLKQPRVGGITLYWSKPDADHQRSITAKRLELDLDRQQLYIYSQAQPELVIRVALPGIVYQIVELKNPQIAGTRLGDGCLVLFRDPEQQIEVKLTLSQESISKLLESIPH